MLRRLLLVVGLSLGQLVGARLEQRGERGLGRAVHALPGLVALDGMFAALAARTTRAIDPQTKRTFGSRAAPGSTPFYALIKYAYAILETEATITLHTHGFDPGRGILHTD